MARKNFSRKALLTESEMRRFMKLANLQPLNEMEKVDHSHPDHEFHDGAKGRKPGSVDLQNVSKSVGKGVNPPRKLTEEDEMEEEDYMDGEDSMDDETEDSDMMDDEAPMDDMDPEMDDEAPMSDDLEGSIERIVSAIASAIEAETGVPVSVDGGMGDEASMDDMDPEMDDMDPDMSDTDDMEMDDVDPLEEDKTKRALDNLKKMQGSEQDKTRLTLQKLRHPGAEGSERPRNDGKTRLIANVDEYTPSQDTKDALDSLKREGGQRRRGSYEEVDSPSSSGRREGSTTRQDVTESRLNEMVNRIARRTVRKILMSKKQNKKF